MAATAKALAKDGEATEAVRWPKNSIDPDGGDLAGPTALLLRRLALLETNEDVESGVGPVKGTPYSLQVITAGATDGAKVAGVAASSASFTGAVGSAVAAYKATELPLQIALIAAIGVILAAGVVSVAIIVRSDVSARAAATVAAYDARAAVATEFLRQAAAKAAPAPSPAEKAAESHASMALLQALSAYPSQVTAKSTDGGEQRLTGLRLGAEGLQVRLATGDWIKIDAVTSFTATT